MPTLTMLTPEELHDRRAALLQESGLTEKELRSLGEQYALPPEQSDLLDELREIDFLLAE